MREIKFRAKAGTQWRYGDLYHNEHGELMIYEPKTSGQTLEGETVDGWRIKVDPETVGQYTGLHDCEGREIYEGDIVRNIDLFPHQCGVIIYYSELARFFIDVGDGDINDLDAREHIEVIGNIHDNPNFWSASHDADLYRQCE